MKYTLEEIETMIRFTQTDGHEFLDVLGIPSNQHNAFYNKICHERNRLWLIEQDRIQLQQHGPFASLA